MYRPRPKTLLYVCVCHIEMLNPDVFAFWAGILGRIEIFHTHVSGVPFISVGHQRYAIDNLILQEDINFDIQNVPRGPTRKRVFEIVLPLQTNQYTLLC